MRNYKVNVVVHVNETLSDGQLGEVRAGIRSLEGVMRVQPSERLNRLVLVDYDPRVVSAQDILHSVRRRGVGTRLIGM